MDYIEKYKKKYKNIAKSLGWVVNQLPKIENPVREDDKFIFCIRTYCESGADAIMDLISRAEEAEKKCKRMEDSLDFARTKDAEILRLGKELEQAEKEKNIYKAILQNWHEEG